MKTWRACGCSRRWPTTSPIWCSSSAGRCPGGHGDGMRGPFTEKMFGPALHQAFRTVSAFDPDASSTQANRRHPAADGTSAFRRRLPDAGSAGRFDYAEFGGLERAVEMCSGLGVCRKTLEGTMRRRPWRRARRSTRPADGQTRCGWQPGRLGEAGLNGHDVHDVLDLCLECRACKAECPVGVDVARFKSEFLATYWGRHGLPMRVRTIGHAEAAETGSRFAPLSNIVAPPAGGSTSSCSGSIGAGRRPPTRAETFARRFASRFRDRVPRAPSRQPPAAGPRRFFNDTFTNYNHPEIGVAAASFLDAAGHTHLVPHGCCGRPLISQGLLDEARVAAHALLNPPRHRRSRRPGSSSSSRAALGGARGRAGAAARRAAAGSGCRHGVHAVRGLRRGGMAPRPDQRCAATGAVNRPAARPLSSERWA